MIFPSCTYSFELILTFDWIKGLSGGDNPPMLPVVQWTVEALVSKKAPGTDSIMARAHITYIGLVCISPILL